MEWVSLPCSDTPPRNSHAAVLDGDTMVIIGGASPSGQTDEVFTIDFSDRSNLKCVRVDCQPSESGASVAHSDGVGGVPAARDMHSACVYNSEVSGGVGASILVMGGRSSAGVLEDLFSLSTGTAIDPPNRRACFTGVIIRTHGWVTATRRLCLERNTRGQIVSCVCPVVAPTVK